MILRCVNDIKRDCALNIALDEFFFTKEPFENIFRFYRWTEPAYTIGYFQQYSIAEGRKVGRSEGQQRQTTNDNDTAQNNNVQCIMYNVQQTTTTINDNQRQLWSAMTDKETIPVVRRLTGGLAVLHDTDLSYSLIVSEDIWKYIYNQEMTYKIIHENIRKALEKIGIFSMYNVQCTMYNRQQEKQKIRRLEEMKKSFSCVKTLYKDDLMLDGKKIVGSCQRRRGKKILVEGSIHLQLSDEQINIFTEEFFKNLSKELQTGTINKALTKEEIIAGEKLCTEKYNNEKWNKLF